MPITRRQLCLGAASVALAVAALGTSALTPWPAAMAQSVAMDELMKPPALPDMVLGSKDAPVTVIEYASMTCPHCAHFTNTTFPEFKKRYIDSGKARYIFREFPLDALALDGAMLARCVAKDDPNRYIAMIEVLFKQQPNWVKRYPEGTEHPGLTNSALLGVAKQAGFTEKTYRECLTNQQIAQGVLASLQRAGNDYKVRSTPTFFINGERAVGALTIEEISQKIDPQLKDK